MLTSGHMAFTAFIIPGDSKCDRPTKKSLNPANGLDFTVFMAHHQCYASISSEKTLKPFSLKDSQTMANLKYHLRKVYMTDGACIIFAWLNHQFLLMKIFRYPVDSPLWTSPFLLLKPPFSVTNFPAPWGPTSCPWEPALPNGYCRGPDLGWTQGTCGDQRCWPASLLSNIVLFCPYPAVLISNPNFPMFPPCFFSPSLSLSLSLSLSIAFSKSCFFIHVSQFFSRFSIGCPPLFGGFLQFFLGFPTVFRAKPPALPASQRCLDHDFEPPELQVVVSQVQHLPWGVVALG